MEEGDEKGMQGTTGGPTIDGIKSAKEVARCARGAESGRAGAGIQAQRKQIQFTIDSANRRGDQTPPPTGITDVHN